MNFLIDVMWIPSLLGGHNSAPYDGMRVSIRWQKHIAEHLECARDVECKVVNFDNVNLLSRLSCTLVSNIPIPQEWAEPGELVELLSGFRVLAVGKVLARTQ
ncbi:hypothetical protein ACQUJT_18665 [Ralstonia pseudosolanacearum]